MWHQTVSLRPAWFGQTRRPSAVPRPALRPAGYARINRRSWPARQQEQQRLAVTGASVSLSNDSGTAAQRLLQLSQRHDTQAAGDSHFHQQLTVEERLARIEMLLQQGVTEETVQRIITSNKGGPYMKSASQGAAILAVLRERGCSDADMNHVLQFQPSVLGRTAGSIGDVFAALDDMLQLSRPKILRVCLRQPSLLTHYSDTLRQRWSWVQAHYGLSRAAVASLAKRMVSSRAVGNLLVSNQDTIMNRWSGMQRLFELSDAEVSKLFPYLAELLEADPEQHIRPRWDLYQSLLGEFDPADKRRFMTSPGSLQLPETTIRNVLSGHSMIVALSCAWQVSSRRESSTQRPSGVGWRPRPAGHGRFSNNRRSWPARQVEQQRLAITGESASSSVDSVPALRLLQLSQQHDTLTVGDRRQLTAEERQARIEMLLQLAVTEETVQHMIVSSKGGPYMQSASEVAAILAVLRDRGCSDADMNLLLRLRPDVITRPASSISDVFAALDDMLQLSRPKILRVCLQQSSLLIRDSDKLRQRWSWVQAHYGLSKAAVSASARRMVNSRHVSGLLTYNQDTITVRFAGLQRVLALSDAEVSKLLPYLAELLEADPEQHIRPRWLLYQSLLGKFDPDDKRRFITSRGALQLPEPTIRNVFSGVEQLMGSTAAAQSLLLRAPKSFVSGIKRLATNLGALQQLYGCSLQQAQQVLMRTPQIAYLMLEAPKFQSRVAALTEWYGHASPAAMLLVPARGSQLMSSMWKLGARMAFIRRLRLERAEPELNTKQLAFTTERFCQAVRVSEEVYAAFEQRWLASPEAAELCRHEDPPHVKVIGAAEAET
ncbi:hypothetical protein ACK3TF_005011 [Chlorella vulgaris]